MPIEFTSEGDVDGGLSWLVGATLDFSFTRALCAPYYGTRGGPATTRPASSCSKWPPKWISTSIMPSFVAICTTATRAVATGSSPACMTHVPGEDDLCHFRYRIGDEVIDQIIAVVVDLLSHFGLIKGELLSTDGQLEPSYSRYKGCTYACEGCQAFPLDEADRQALGEQLQSGAKRLQITCPFPEVVDKVRAGDRQKGHPSKTPRSPCSRSRRFLRTKPRTRSASTWPSCSGCPKTRCPRYASNGVI